MHASPDILYGNAALLCAGIAAVTDLRTRRIPNWLTGAGALCGALLHLALGGPAQAGLAVLAGLLAGGVFLVFFLAGGMGAGDVKLMAAVGCLGGLAHIRTTLLATVLLGAAAALLTALWNGRLRETLLNARTLVAHHNANGLAAHAELNVGNASMLRLPYAVPVAGGCMASLLLQTLGGA